MRIINEQVLRGNARSEPLRSLREDALNILCSAVEAVDPREAVFRVLTSEKKAVCIKDLTINEPSRIIVTGGGKASGRMSEAVEMVLGNRISEGIVIVPKGTKSSFKLNRIQLAEAPHPIPDESSIEASKRIFSLLTDLEESDLVLVLISGGGSSLMTHPARGVSLEDIQRVTTLLLKSGATIHELNTVRKHLSAIKGGQLARRAYPSQVVSLILSDVVGDRLDVIASGPTSPDDTTFKDAYMVLKKYGLLEEAGESIRRRLEAGLKGEVPETPKSGDKTFRRVYNLIIGNNFTAAHAAKKEAENLGYHSILLSTRVEGEAKYVGMVCAAIANEISSTGFPTGRPAAVILGGETTVKVLGEGRGGRNQELALSAAMKLDAYQCVIAALATDGVDGPTDAAGAIIDSCTIERAREAELSPEEYLSNNDSNTFFSTLGDTILTGPTGTNVNDILVILAA
ncbi:glycerate kinase [Candidatus Bathyarchaeota archaeon]|nr:glycerate kinase [Candidatus Bathyarchaeota archaeon]